MMPLPTALGGRGEVVAWRLDRSVHAAAWNSGEGARAAGGRWNSQGVAAVYASLDPAATILERAVHGGFALLDAVPHVLTAFTLNSPESVHIVQPEQIPDAKWLRPVLPGRGQQQYGDQLLAMHLFIAVPSAVSTHSWNLVFDPQRAAGHYQVTLQEPFDLDTRLKPS